MKSNIEIILSICAPLIALIFNYIFNYMTERKQIRLDLENGQTEYYLKAFVNGQDKEKKYRLYLEKVLLLFNRLRICSIQTDKKKQKIGFAKKISRHYLYAIIYTLLIFYLCWVFGAGGNIGSLVIFKQISVPLKILLTTILLIIGSIVIFIYSNVKNEKTRNNFKKVLFIIIGSTIIGCLALLQIGTPILISIFILILLYITIGGISTVSIEDDKNIIIGTNIGIEIGIVGATVSIELGIVTGLIVSEIVQYNIHTLIGIICGIFSTILISLLVYLTEKLIKKYLKKKNIWLFVFNSILIILALLSIYIFKNLINYQYTIIIVFFVLIPGTNAFMDFYSTTASMKFIQILYDGELCGIEIKTRHTVAVLIIDLVIALITMILLVFSIVFWGQLFNIFYINGSLIEKGIYAGVMQYIDFKLLIMNFTNNPFDINNLWITFMLFTTFIPTIIHIVFDPIRLFAIRLFKHKRDVTEDYLSKLNATNINSRNSDYSYFLQNSTNNILLFKSLKLIAMPFTLIILFSFIKIVIINKNIGFDFLNYLAAESIKLADWISGLLI